MRWFKWGKKVQSEPSAPDLPPSVSEAREDSPEHEIAGCGHATKTKGYISAFGQTAFLTMPRNKEGGFDFCLDCVAAMSIRCAWCDNVIFIGSPVTLYTPRSEFDVPEHAVVYKEKPLQLVGCLGWNCADTGGDRAGFWVPNHETGKGHVHRMMSPIEMALQGHTVIVNDLGDLNEEPTVIG